MGFSLSMHAAATFAEHREIASVLASEFPGETFCDQINLDSFSGVEGLETFAYDGDDGHPVQVNHWEVGWSYWLITQIYVTNTLGEAKCPTTLHMHAWRGVTVPWSCECGVLGRERPRKFKLFRSKIEKATDDMIQAYGGPSDNWRIGSSTALLAELEHCIAKRGLDSNDLGQRYDVVIENENEEAIGEFYLLLVAQFLRQAIKHNHLVWWEK